MASGVSRGIAKTVKGRLFASQAAAYQTAESATPLSKQSPKLTKLPNGVVVASLENNSPISRVSVVINAGSRFEDGDNIGITHCLRASAGLTNANSSIFGITKNIQQAGAQLTCTSSREYMFYTLDCTRNNLEKTIHYLRDITTAHSLRPWELADIKEKLQLDIAHLNEQPAARSFDLLHEAAFRTTLGRSLYAPNHMLGKYTPEQVHHYVNNHYTTGRVAIVGVGVEHDDLIAEANKYTFAGSSGVTNVKASYGGGEIRINTGRGLTSATVAVEGPSLAAKELLHAGVLQNIMGSGPYIKYSSHTIVPRLGQAVAKVTSEPFSVSCVNANYTDGGLFGFAAVSHGREIGKVLKAAFDQFAGVTKGNITDEEVARAKKQLKSGVYMYLENGSNVLTDMAEQALGHQQIIHGDDIAKAIDATTTSDVVNVAKKIINSKPSMAIVGDLSRAPYLDDLYR